MIVLKWSCPNSVQNPVACKAEQVSVPGELRPNAHHAPADWGTIPIFSGQGAGRPHRGSASILWHRRFLGTDLDSTRGSPPCALTSCSVPLLACSIRPRDTSKSDPIKPSFFRRPIAFQTFRNPETVSAPKRGAVTAPSSPVGGWGPGIRKLSRPPYGWGPSGPEFPRFSTPPRRPVHDPSPPQREGAQGQGSAPL